MTNAHRLPRAVVPDRYVLRLEPDLASATFLGRAEISATVTEAVDQIVLNAAELAISSVEVTSASGSVTSATIGLDPELERATFDFADPIASGPITIAIEFSGVLNDKLRGFYRSTYTDEDGVEHVLATTQFESTNARRAFPCWDEPDLKATFDVTLIVDADLMAISGQSEIASRDLGDGRREVVFAPTPIMSTYLLAFVVGDLEATEPVMAGGVPMRVIHRPGMGHMTGFAIEAGTFAMDWLTDYFGIPYPGDKCDLVAIPDFAFGAMENMGCITFREILLFVDPDTTTQPEQQRSVDVIAHELAHMWFGNLVTMRWWNGLWLKEAFATFMEMAVTDAYRPEWERWVDFGMSRTEAFSIDSLSSTRPIEFEVHSPDDAEGMYDTLTYEKGAAVVRMLETYLGAEQFKAGVSNYLSTHAFDNTETHDLWESLEETTGHPVRRIMDTWIFQGGYPLVSVSLDESASSEHLRISQQQFRYPDLSENGTPVEPRRWAIPLVISCGLDGQRTQSTALLDDDETSVGPGATPDWALVNTGAYGFYRVTYDDALLSAIVSHLDEIDAIERYALVDDMWAQVVAGGAGVREMIALIQNFQSEKDVSVWRRVLRVLASLEQLSAGDDRRRLAEITRTLTQPCVERLGLSRAPRESDRTNELRAALFQARGTTGGDEDALDRSRHLNAAGIGDASMLSAALTIVATHGTDDDFAETLSRFRHAPSPQLERRNLFALARFPEAHHMDQALALTIDGGVRTQDAPHLISVAMANRDHGERAWRFVEQNWDLLRDKFPDNSIPSMLRGMTALSHADVAADVESFLEAHPIPQGHLKIAQLREQLSINVGLRARVAAQLKAGALDS